MKKSFFVISLLLLLTGFFFSPAGAQKVPGPHMVIPEPSFNFKLADEGDLVVHDFKILNQGDAPLEIKDVRPD